MVSASDFQQTWDWPGFQVLEMKNTAPVNQHPFSGVDRIFGWDSPEVGLRALRSYAAGQTPSYAELAGASGSAQASAQPAGWPSLGLSLPDLSPWLRPLQKFGIGLGGVVVALLLILAGVFLWSKRGG